MGALLRVVAFVLATSGAYLALDSMDSLNVPPDVWEDECGTVDVEGPADPETEALRAKLGASDDGGRIVL